MESSIDGEDSLTKKTFRQFSGKKVSLWTCSVDIHTGFIKLVYADAEVWVGYRHCCNVPIKLIFSAVTDSLLDRVVWRRMKRRLWCPPTTTREPPPTSTPTYPPWSTTHSRSSSRASRWLKVGVVQPTTPTHPAKNVKIKELNSIQRWAESAYNYCLTVLFQCVFASTKA